MTLVSLENQKFGGVMPIHIDMLQVVGYVPASRERDIRPVATDEDCLRAMRAGRAALRRAKGNAGRRQRGGRGARGRGRL